MQDLDARRAVAHQLHRLADRLATADVAPEGWEAMLDHLAAAEAAVGETPETTRFARAVTSVLTGTAADVSIARDHPLGEATSGVYPPLDLELVRDDLLVARTRFGPAWEGPPGLVHGGYLAAGFDIVMSALAGRLLDHSITRRLQLRYLKPTFLPSELRWEVEPGERDGRLLELRARLYADDRLTMKAVAQFVAIDLERFADRRPGAFGLPATPEA